MSEGSSFVGSADDACALVREGLDAFASVDLHALGDRRVLLEELIVLQRRLDAAVLRTVGAFDAHTDWAADGAASGAAWMRGHLRLAPGTARSAVATARRLPNLPVMESAFAEGTIARDHVQAVTRVMERTPERRDTVAAAEPTFAVAAEQLDPAQFAKVVDRWVHTVDPLGAVDAECTLRAQRYLSVSRTMDGAVAINGLLAPEPGAMVLAAIEALATEDFRTNRAQHDGDGAGGAAESTTPGQRRCDALVELCRRFLDSGTAPEVAGARPHVQIVVAAESLAARAGVTGVEPAVLDGVGPLSTEAARRIACDADVSGVRVSSVGLPLAYGRTRRVVPASLRKVIRLRDGGCRFPGCDRPAEWTQAHHIAHWGHGGRTDADNLVLLCTLHHHVVHERGFAVRGSPQLGTLTFHRPDGSVLKDTGRFRL